MPDVRLIDANALKKEMVEVEIVTPPHNHHCSELVVFGYDIDEAPTIDTVPVVHGRWVETGKVFVHSMYDLFTECSLCSFRHVRNEYQEPYHYCPNCGARMDGGASDG